MNRYYLFHSFLFLTSIFQIEKIRFLIKKQELKNTFRLIAKSREK